MDIKKIQNRSLLVALVFGALVVVSEHWFYRLVSVVVLVVAVALWALACAEEDVVEVEVLPTHVDTEL